MEDDHKLLLNYNDDLKEWKTNSHRKKWKSTSKLNRMEDDPPKNQKKMEDDFKKRTKKKTTKNKINWKTPSSTIKKNQPVTL
jgi:hypothetical protein